MSSVRLTENAPRIRLCSLPSRRDVGWPSARPRVARRCRSARRAGSFVGTLHSGPARGSSRRRKRPQLLHGQLELDRVIALNVADSNADEPVMTEDAPILDHAAGHDPAAEGDPHGRAGSDCVGKGACSKPALNSRRVKQDVVLCDLELKARFRVVWPRRDPDYMSSATGDRPAILRAVRQVSARLGRRGYRGAREARRRTTPQTKADRSSHADASRTFRFSADATRSTAQAHPSGRGRS